MKSSKVIENETVIELEDGRTLFHGKYNGITRVTIRGMYDVTEKRKPYDYKNYIDAADKEAHKRISRDIEQRYGRYIVETFPTTTGIRYGTTKNYRVTVYVRTDEDESQTAYTIAEIVNEHLSKSMQEQGFALSNKRQTPRGGRKKKKN